MTVDIRAAAEREANRLRVTSHGREYGMSRPYKDGFTDAAVWAQAQLTPTREQIAEVIRSHKLVHVAVSRRSAFCACNPSITADADDNRAWFERHLADAILALLQERGSSGA